MTSSIYPRSVDISFSVSSSFVIDTPGSGYTGTPTVTITGGGGTGATADPVVGDGVINIISIIGGTNSGYTDGESITLSAPSGGGTTATATAVISSGIIQSISFTNRGEGYAVELVTITGDDSTTSTATFNVTSVTTNGITSISLTTAGTGYTSIPSVSIIADTGGTLATATAALTIQPSTDILASDVEITSDMVKPGGGGVLRLYFAFVFDDTPGDITVTNNGVDKGALNADNDGQIITNGYYRFDIDVEADDEINLVLKGTATATEITSVNFIRAHLVQFGA